MEGKGRLRLAVLFGGRSAEHEVSLRSARAVLEHLDGSRFEARPIGITREGGWLSPEDSRVLLAGKACAAQGGAPWLPEGCECVFPVLHGPYGEDGSLQGWLELLGMPFVGSGSAASAVAMDKGLCKRVLRDGGVPVLDWLEARRGTDPAELIPRVAAGPGFPCFVKPMRLGSSVGISRVADPEALPEALARAWEHDPLSLIEAECRGRELEVAVLEADPLLVAPPGEIRPRGWYDYRAKYEDASAELLAPAPDLSAENLSRLRELAERSFALLRLSGLARIDFFLPAGGAPLVNEVNTLPGFTAISMYPRLMALAGISFTELVSRLVDQALSTRRS